MKVKERQLIEEHKKLQEKEEILRRDEREREERERKMKALEQELSKQKVNFFHICRLSLMK